MKRVEKASSSDSTTSMPYLNSLGPKSSCLPLPELYTTLSLDFELETPRLLVSFEIISKNKQSHEQR